MSSNGIKSIQSEIQKVAKEKIKQKINSQYIPYVFYEWNSVYPTQMAFSEDTIYHLKHFTALTDGMLTVNDSGDGYQLSVDTSAFQGYRCHQFIKQAVQNAITKMQN